MNVSTPRGPLQPGVTSGWKSTSFDLMRARLKPGSYRAWRKRVRAFSDRREVYK